MAASWRLATDHWRAAALTAAPSLLASLLFAARLAGLPGLDEARFAGAGLALSGGCLGAAALARARGRPGGPACLATAGALGLTAPALALHLLLAERALRDPVMIVVTPATVSLGLLAGGSLLSLALPLIGRPAPAQIGPCLLTTGLLLIWLPALAGRAEAPLVWGALALSFALGALAWFGATLLRGWLAALPCLAALLPAWLAALSVPGAAIDRDGAAAWLLPAHLALALAGSLLPLLLPAAVAGWQRRRAAGRAAPAARPQRGSA
jgi:hypothetical protein